MPGTRRGKPYPIITLTTDFGTASPYAAAMKGVILALYPAARLVDLSHAIPPQDVRHAAFFLAAALPWFPPEALHVVVVDPGVGTERAILYVEVVGRRLLVPDNGCWTLLDRAKAEPTVIRVEDRRYWQAPVSATFHGRDIFAPVAAQLSGGLPPERLGPRVHEWVRLETSEPRATANGFMGEVVFIDDFGNIITNIRADKLQAPDVLTVGDTTFREGAGFRRVRSYAEAQPGTLIALTSSVGLFEVAVAQGSAAKRLGVKVGDPVTVGWQQ